MGWSSFSTVSYNKSQQKISPFQLWPVTNRWAVEIKTFSQIYRFKMIIDFKWTISINIHRFCCGLRAWSWAAEAAEKPDQLINTNRIGIYLRFWPESTNSFQKHKLAQVGVGWARTCVEQIRPIHRRNELVMSFLRLRSWLE